MKRTILAAVAVAALVPSTAIAGGQGGGSHDDKSYDDKRNDDRVVGARGNIFATIKDGRTLTILSRRGSKDVPLGVNAVDANGVATGNTLAMGERIVGIDVRPRTGQLFGLSSANQFYVIDPRTGTTTKVGSPFAPQLVGKVGIDFNPTVDRIRITTSTDQNLRFNPDTGGLAFTDGNLKYAGDDDNAGKDPNVVANGYSFREFGAPGTELYDIDSAQDTITEQDPPNDGVLNTVGDLNIDVGDDRAGFDVPGQDPDSEIGFGLFVVNGVTRIYRVNTETGRTALTRIAVPGNNYDGLTGLSGYGY